MDEITNILNYLFRLKWEYSNSDEIVSNFLLELTKIEINDCIIELDLAWESTIFLDIIYDGYDERTIYKLLIDNDIEPLRSKLLSKETSYIDITDYIKSLKRNYNISKL